MRLSDNAWYMGYAECDVQDGEALGMLGMQKVQVTLYADVLVPASHHLQAPGRPFFGMCPASPSFSADSSLSSAMR